MLNLKKIDRWFDFLSVPPKPLLGLDLSISTMKFVVLNKKRGKIILEGYAVEKTPKEAFNDQGVTNPELLGDHLEKTWKRMGSSIKAMGCGIPTNSTISKKVKISKDLEEKAFLEEVNIEASQFVPFPLDSVYVDWDIVGDHPSAPEANNEVLIIASRKDRITDLMASAESAGLEITLIDNELNAHQHAFHGLAKFDPGLYEEVVMVLDGGHSVLNMMIYNKGNLIFTKDIAYGLSQMNDMISNVYEVNHDKAEDVKRNGPDEHMTGYQEQIVEPFLDNWAMEVNRALQFFLTQASVEGVNRVLITGGVGCLSGVINAVQNILQIPCQIANPFEYMDVSNKFKKGIERDAPLLFTAFGLALRRFDEEEEMVKSGGVEEKKDDGKNNTKKGK